jgi:hypothetical protein
MSAFIVEPSTINVFLTWAQRSKDCQRYMLRELHAMGYSVEDDEKCDELGRAMFELNVRAVEERYTKLTPAERLELWPYKYKTTHAGPGVPLIDCVTDWAPGAHAAIRALDCWHYQCSEGTVPELPLYKAFEDLPGRIAHHIVARSREYEAVRAAVGW